MPVEIELGEVSTSGLYEPKADWTLAARTHVVEHLADFLGDDPRYQALLAEAGSTR